MDDLLTFDLALFTTLLIKLVIAFVLALPIGLERELSVRSAGLRTFPLVSIGACSYVLVAVQLVGEAPDAQSRVLQGLMTGIGFVGGGAILKDRKMVTGTATASSIWATSAIGTAVAYGQIELALLVALLTVGVLRLLYAVEQRIHIRLRGHTDDPS
jgi:putative Mg2+ transporter-C (MgtC) family protein